MKRKKVLVTGDRQGYSLDKITEVLKQLWEDGYRILSHGGARGVDFQAGAVAHSIGYEIRVYKAEWGKYGKAAGPHRNKHMLVMEMPDLVVGFHALLSESRGTADCLRQARKMHINSVLYGKDEDVDTWKF